MAGAIVPFLSFKSDSAFAEQLKTSRRPILLKNLRLFDGITSTVTEGRNVRVDGNKVVDLPAAGGAPGDVEIIDCGGRLVMAGGGVTSPYDPLDSLPFTEAELRAGVAAASDWGTYVMVHVYTAKDIERAVRAGVRSIEHGQLADEKVVRMMADKGIGWSLQPFLADEDANKLADPAARANQLRVAEGTVKAYEMAQKFNVQTAWETDILFTPQNLPQQGRMLAKLTRFYPPLDLLLMATGQNGQLLMMSGLRNPYEGELGTIAPGSLADILVADGDPTVSLDFLTNPDDNLRLIMKDGKIYKSTLA